MRLTLLTNHPNDLLVITSFSRVPQVKAFSILTSVKLLVKIETSDNEPNYYYGFSEEDYNLYNVPVEPHPIVSS